MPSRLVLLALLLTTLLSLASRLPSAAARPRSTVAPYRPSYPPYHSYASYVAEVESIASDAANTRWLRLLRSERASGGEQLRLLQLSDWSRRPSQEEDPDQRRAEQALHFADGAADSAPRTTRPSRRLRVLLSFGEHARELITVESFFFLMHYLLHGARDAANDCSVLGSLSRADGFAEVNAAIDGVALVSSPGFRARFASFLLRHADLHLLGVTNPSGKLRLERTGDYCWRNTADGVDLNRNGEWEWGGPASTQLPGSEEYPGTKPLSEVETRFLSNLAKQYAYDAYVSVHSGEQQLFVPFVDTASKATRRTRFSSAAERRVCKAVGDGKFGRGWLHDSGVGYDMNDYSADGTIMDHMAGVERIPYVFCVELWGGRTHPDCFVQFNPDSTVDSKFPHLPPPSLADGLNPPATSQLGRDLRRMHAVHVDLLVQLLAEHGLQYSDPAEDLDLDRRKRRLDAIVELCEIEKKLERTMQRNDKRAPKQT